MKQAMNEKENIIASMRNLISQSNMVYTKQSLPSENQSPPLPPSVQPSKQDIWLESLPAVENECFLLDTYDEDNLIIFCVKELDWQTAMNIDMKSFRSGDRDVDYYSEEYERRQTLSKSIVWVADSNEQKIIYNTNEQILNLIKYEILDTIWNKYKAITNVTTQEAQQLYESTKKYLNGEAQEGIPIPPIIPKTIAICDGWCSLNLQELNSLTAGEWERMQIIKMARTDLMGIYTQQQISAQTIQSIKHDTANEPNNNINFNSWSERFPIGHPNRPPGT
jgi:hypothetical protein